MMTIDRLGWRSESRPDLAEEVSRRASLTRSRALDELVAEHDEIRKRNARETRNWIVGGTIALTLLCAVLIGAAILQDQQLTQEMHQAIERIVY